jgi:hypothetical protein
MNQESNLYKYGKLLSECQAVIYGDSFPTQRALRVSELATQQVLKIQIQK